MTMPLPHLALEGLEGFTSFSHEAMATHFTLHLPPGAQARAVAREAFHVLDRLEDKLSFYREASDVSRINLAAPGTVLRVDEATMECLTLALEVAFRTGGAFDPFVGAAALPAKGQATPAHLVGREVPPSPPDPADPVVAIDPASGRVTKLAGRRWLDLGALGKGYALDAMAGQLRDWEVADAVLVAGGSSVLVMGSPPAAADGCWTLRVPQDGAAVVLRLAAPFALGAAGEGFQPGHIIAPGGGASLRRERAWVVAREAALADALATAAVLCPAATLAELTPEGGGILGGAAPGAGGEPVATGVFESVIPRAALGRLVIPCWREDRRLPGFLRPLLAALAAARLPGGVEVVVVDDGSPPAAREATRHAVEELRATYPGLRPLMTLPRTGKGGAIRAGWAQASSGVRWLAFVDADGAISPAEVVRGLRAAAGQAGPILFAASRYHDRADLAVDRGFIRGRTGARFAAWAARQLELPVSDPQCGFKIVRAAWWRSHEAEWREVGYAHDLELLGAARSDGVPILDWPIAWHARPGSKVNWRDGWELIQTVKRMRRALAPDAARRGRGAGSGAVARVDGRGSDRGSHDPGGTAGR
jgi:thiamine biosynthesis lipoprotein ApbE/GT2 family glycosyltransferase